MPPNLIVATPLFNQHAHAQAHLEMSSILLIRTLCWVLLMKLPLEVLDRAAEDAKSFLR